MSEPELREITAGLRFPEGPVAMPDGSVVLVEIARATLSRVDVASGEITVVSECGGGPNGAALGPDGMIYVANNGAYFRWHDADGVLIPIPLEDHDGGCLQRIDPATGAVEVLYDSCDGRRLVAPNDLVFDDHGGIWFTDHGVAPETHPDHAGVLYARADGSSITGAAYGTAHTNGVGLSPAGDRLYVAETHSGMLWQWAVTAPGELAPIDGLDTDLGDHSGGHLLFDAPQGHLFDSLAVDGDGWVCVATIGQGGITAVAPDGSASEHHAFPDFLVTNICFADRTPDGEPDPDRRTAYVTCSSSGRLLAMTWPRPGLRLVHQ